MQRGIHRSYNCSQKMNRKILSTESAKTSASKISSFGKGANCIYCLVKFVTFHCFTGEKATNLG